MTNPKLAEMALKILSNDSFDLLWDEEYFEKTILEVHNKAYELGRADENEECAKLIQDWHVPRKGGTHSMAFAIRSRRKGTGGVGA